jgi:predicted transcriptional regulator
MNTSERKYKIIEQLLKVEEESTLYQIEGILNKESNEEWDKLPLIVQQLIDKGIEQSEAGLGVPHEQVMEKIRKKYNFS